MQDSLQVFKQADQQANLLDCCLDDMDVVSQEPTRSAIRTRVLDCLGFSQTKKIRSEVGVPMLRGDFTFWFMRGARRIGTDTDVQGRELISIPMCRGEITDVTGRPVPMLGGGLYRCYGEIPRRIA